MLTFPRCIILWSLITASLAQGKECIKCNSEDSANCAVNPLLLSPEQCRDPDDHCVTAIVHGVTKRGCKKELTLPNYAMSEDCNSSRCNNELFPKNRIICYHCKGRNCADFEDFENNAKACVNYVETDHCVTDVINKNNVIRGCGSDTGYKLGKFASICFTNNCNKEPAMKAVKCTSCAHTNSTSCARKTEPTEIGKFCTIPDETFCTAVVLHNHPACFIYNKANEVVRGCIQNAGELASDTKHFTTCSHNMCNNRCLSIKKCIQCDSMKNPKCVDQPSELEAEECEKGIYKCMVGKTKDGRLVRGCGGIAMDEMVQNVYCYEDGCNKEIYVPPPDIRKNLQCYQCYNAGDCVLALYLPKVPHCKLPTDICYQYLNDRNEMIRGCKSDKNYAECSAQGKKCYQCSTNRCNNRKEVRTPTYNDNLTKCLSCSRYDKNCPYSLNRFNAATCQPEALYYEDEFACYNCLMKDSKAERGCVSPTNERVSSCEKYEVCKTDTCNEKPLISQSCIQCDSVFGTCNKDVTGTICTKDLSADTMGCYSKRKDGRIIKGCVSDLQGEQVCKGDEEFCKICTKQNCNTGVAGAYARVGVIFASLLVPLYFSI